MTPIGSARRTNVYHSDFGPSPRACQCGAPGMPCPDCNMSCGIDDRRRCRLDSWSPSTIRGRGTDQRSSHRFSCGWHLRAIHWRTVSRPLPVSLLLIEERASSARAVSSAPNERWKRTTIPARPVPALGESRSGRRRACGNSTRAPGVHRVPAEMPGLPLSATRSWAGSPQIFSSRV
jgi:hypothetical protein